MADDKLSDVLVALNKPSAERSADDRALIGGAGHALKDAAEAVRTGMANLTRDIGPMFGTMPLPSGDYKPIGLRPLDVHESEALRGVAREGQEQRARGIATLSVLQTISRQLDDLSLRMSKHDEQIKEHENELVRLRSGASGRPSAMHLIRNEFERRVALGQLEATVTAQSVVLEAWLRKEHPEAASTTAKTIRNSLSISYREARAHLQPSPAKLRD